MEVLPPLNLGIHLAVAAGLLMPTFYVNPHACTDEPESAPGGGPETCTHYSHYSQPAAVSPSSECCESSECSPQTPAPALAPPSESSECSECSPAPALATPACHTAQEDLCPALSNY